jgi:hypothetical protein
MPEDSPNRHLVDFPEALETLFARLDELRVVLGAAAAPAVGEVERRLRESLAARERGDVPAAVTGIGHAMERLAALVGDTDPAEAAAMRAAAEGFRRALVRGAVGEARQRAEVMREHSGSVVTPKPRR